MLLNYKEEWILSNLNGSYSSSSTSFANLRTYHGLCVKGSAVNYERTVLLAKMFEEFTAKGQKFSLDTNYYRDVIYPEGYRLLAGYELDPIPTFHFKLDGLDITKSLVMDPVNDWLVIKYDLDGDLPSSFFLHPLLAFRNYHLAMKRRDMDIAVKMNDNLYEFQSGENYIKIQTGGNFVQDGDWYYNFQYPLDRERGSNYEEDLYHPGHFEIKSPHASFEVKISCSEGMPGSFNSVKGRMLMSKSSLKGDLAQIARSSTAFIVKDDIIAGFYWFGPWTRDTMISMPGLLLVTKKYRLARKILLKYAGLVNEGMMPVTVTDQNNVSSADTSLWFIYALYKYYKYTSDKGAVRKIYPSIIKILNAYIKGNDFVKLEGSLIRANKPLLTWMDARTGDVIFTPRAGLPVEVNALWYNALSTADFLSRELGVKINDEISGLVPQVKEEFRKRFVTGSGILDVADPDDDSLRPNFVLAFSMPFPIMDNFMQYSAPVKDKLLTKYGLRSLSPDDPKYVGRYAGDQYRRDSAYHNGSVWPWMAGQYITASVRSGASRDDLAEYFRPLLSLRMIPEIFDGDEPHEPKGCIMQAWSYGEIIRAYAEDIFQAGQ